jgi:hypothetical protein
MLDAVPCKQGMAASHGVVAGNMISVLVGARKKLTVRTAK